MNGHMRIGGGEKSLLDLLTHLDYNKHQVDLLLTEGRGEYFDMLPPQVNVRVIETGRAYGSFGKTVLTNLGSGQLWAVYYRLILLLCHCFGKSALCLLRPVFGLKKRYDCAIAYRPGPCADIVAHTIRSRRRICWWHNGKVDYNPEGIRQVDETWRHFDHVVAVSHGCRQMLAEHFSYPTEKIVVIPNMIDTERIKQLAGDRSPYPDDGKVHILTVCRISPEKHLENAILTTQSLIRDGIKNFTWYIIGDGPTKASLEHLIEENKLSKYILLKGSIANPYPYYLFADIYVNTSYQESQSLSVLEAMALNTPCVVTETIGTQGYCINNVNCIIAQQKPEDLFQSVKTLLTSDSVHTQKLTENAYDMVKESFTPKLITQNIIQLLCLD